MERTIEEACTLLLSTATRCRLYGTAHPITQRSAGSLESRFEKIFDDAGRMKIVIQEGFLYCNDRSFSLTIGSLATLAKRLSKRGIGYLEVLPGVGRDEIMDFCSSLADRTAQTMDASEHIKIGDLDIRIQDDERHLLEALRVKNFSGDHDGDVSDEVKDLEILYRHVREHLEVKLKNFDQVVLSFIHRFARQANPFLNLAEIKGHNKSTYLHSSNVANLVIGFGLGLGLKGKEAYHLGMAALLHDVGKQMVPDSILSKPAKLNDEEWKIVKRHPAEGARMLLKNKKVNHLAVVTAFEHHMHFNGEGGYPRTTPARKPSMPSQLVAIADSFDALFCLRSYHERFDIMSALEIILDDAGTVYDPWLVDVFIRYITLNLEEKSN